MINVLYAKLGQNRNEYSITILEKTRALYANAFFSHLHFKIVLDKGVSQVKLVLSSSEDKKTNYVNFLNYYSMYAQGLTRLFSKFCC